MARPLRIQFEGAVYHVVVRANNRQPLFRDNQDKRHYLELVGRYQSQFGFRLYCYFLISRQIHLLIETPRGNLSKVMQCLGTSYSSYFNRRHRRRGTLFEGRYKSYLIDNERYLPEVTCYIHRSCLQSRLATNKDRNYSWSSYRIYLGKKSSDLVDTGPVLARFGQVLGEQRKRYQEFVEAGGVREGARREPGYLEHMGRYPMSTKKTSFQYHITEPARKEDPLRVAERILREVSLSMAVSEIAELRASRRTALARHVAMYLIRKQTSLPLRSIGELLGVKAAAVALGVGKVEQLLKRGDCSPKVRSLLDNNMFPPLGAAEEYPGFDKAVPNGSPVA